MRKKTLEHASIKIVLSALYDELILPWKSDYLQADRERKLRASISIAQYFIKASEDLKLENETLLVRLQSTKAEILRNSQEIEKTLKENFKLSFREEILVETIENLQTEQDSLIKRIRRKPETLFPVNEKLKAKVHRLKCRCKDFTVKNT